MASGTITGSTGNQYIDAKIDWSFTTNTSANTSTVTAKLYYKRNNSGYTTSGTGTFSITINGVKTTQSERMEIGSAWVHAMTAIATVSHNDDGTKSILISASGSIPSSTLTSTSCSGYVTLDTIPRASTITYVNDAKLGSQCSVIWTPKSASFRYKLKFALGDWSETTSAIHPNTTSSYTYTKYSFPLSVAEHITNSTTGKMTVTLYTYSNSGATTQVGSESKTTFTVTVPHNMYTTPNVSMDIEPVNSLGRVFASLYIQGQSKVKATFSGSGQLGAEIPSSSYSMSVQGGTYKGSTCESEYLATAGDSVTVTGKATDSRGYSKTIEEYITVIPYSKPKILPASGMTEIICARCDEDGKLTDSGTYLKIKARRSYSKVEVDGVQKNFCSIRYRYRAESATSFSSWVIVLANTDTSTNEIDTNLSGVVADTTISYVVQVGVIDDVGQTAAVQFIIPTAFVTVDIPEAKKGKRIGIGRYAEDSSDPGIDIGMDMYFDDGTTIHGAFADTVAEIGLYMHETTDTLSGSWRYRKWASGTYDISGIFTVKPTESNAYDGGVGYYSNQIQIRLPFNIKTVQYTGTPTEQHYWLINAALADEDNSIIGFRLARFIQIDTSKSVSIRLVGHGRWK